MSTLIVEVCEVSAVEKHPHADRLGLATIKGWKTAIGFNPESGQFDFKVGDKCVYFPPDAVLPPELANSPYKVCKDKDCDLYNKVPYQIPPHKQAVDGRCGVCNRVQEFKDGTPGRTGAMSYCATLPKDGDGNPVPGGRVKAQRLRGIVSYGFIMKIDPAQGDDPNWPIGSDVKEHFKVTKWEPPAECLDGDAESPCVRFHKYTDIEHFGNYPDVIADGDEVVITEKLHGKNCRIGLVLDADDAGNPVWKFMAGSHDIRRKEWFQTMRRFEANELVEYKVLTGPDVTVGQVFKLDNGFWRVTEVLPPVEVGPGEEPDPRKLFRAEEVVKDGPEGYKVRLRRSDFWVHMTDATKNLLQHLVSDYEWDEEKFSVILFGEMIGPGVQDMVYGLTNRDFRLFDIAVNRDYLDYDVKESLCCQFGVSMVPFLYRGPFNRKTLEDLTNGPTTLCKPEKVKGFKGREGVVVVPVNERIDDRMIPTSTCGRVILKNISADYLDRKGGTDGH